MKDHWMQIKINRRSAYAPLRYEATRPFAVSIGKAFVAESQRGDTARMAFVRGPLLNLLQAASRKIGAQHGPGPLQAELVNVQMFGSYLDGGKVVFDLSKVLVQTLGHSDAEDIPCGELPFPAQSFYLHFGNGSGLSDGGFDIEGAFVVNGIDRMIIDLVPQGFGQEHFLSLPMGETTIGTYVMLNNPTKPISKSLTDSIASVLEQNAAIFAQVADIEKQLTQQYGQVVKVPSPVENLADKAPLLQRALSLIVNTMFYLASEPEDDEEGWSRDTPKEAVEALTASVNPGEIKAIENTLLKAGYSKVRLVGRRFEASAVAGQMQAVVASGKALSSHFRRGHFRRQPYGPERALRKTIFVAPVMVNSGIGAEPQGRIYSADPPL